MPRLNSISRVEYYDVIISLPPPLMPQATTTINITENIITKTTLQTLSSQPPATYSMQRLALFP